MNYCPYCKQRMLVKPKQSSECKKFRDQIIDEHILQFSMKFRPELMNRVLWIENHSRYDRQGNKAENIIKVTIDLALYRAARMLTQLRDEAEMWRYLYEINTNLHNFYLDIT